MKIALIALIVFFTAMLAKASDQSEQEYQFAQARAHSPGNEMEQAQALRPKHQDQKIDKETADKAAAAKAEAAKAADAQAKLDAEARSKKSEVDFQADFAKKQAAYQEKIKAYLEAEKAKGK
jgi:hypothetical protein